MNRISSKLFIPMAIMALCLILLAVGCGIGSILFAIAAPKAWAASMFLCLTCFGGAFRLAFLMERCY